MGTRVLYGQADQEFGRSSAINPRRSAIKSPSPLLDSARIHTFGPYHRGGGRRRQVRDERLGGLRFSGIRGDSCRENYFLLQFGGERADHIQPGRRQHVDGKTPSSTSPLATT